MPFSSSWTRVLALAAGLAASTASAQPYLDPDLSPEARAADLVSRMTLEEKASQTLDRAPAIDRLGVPEYNWWNEALHGVARSGLATVFPQAIGIAATWNDDLVFEMAETISEEARAKHHEYVRNGTRERYQGLTIWSPNINLFRDPRWGRGQETYGEDPYLTGRIAVPFIRGLQGDDPFYFKTIATVKHFAVHSGPEPERHVFDAVVGERDFRETYLPMFETGIREGGAYSLMCAYNRVDGEAACSSDELFSVLRDEWDFPGYVVSDCWALDDIHLNHKLVGTATEAAARAIRAGTDLDCGTRVYPHLVDAVEEGLIPEALVDRALERLFVARFRLGMFDPPERVPYAGIPIDSLDTAEHRRLAERVARESLVLLKNDGTLPLARDLGRIAVIGPNADEWQTLLGNYNGLPADPITPLRGIREHVAPGTEVVYARGADLADGFLTPETIPASALGGLQLAVYGSRDLDAAPLATEPAATVGVDWGDGAPRADLDGDDFGARWTGTLRPTTSGVYRLGARATMQFTLFLDGQLVMDSETPYGNEMPEGRMVQSDSLVLEAGREYALQLDATESTGEATFELMWIAPSDGDALRAEAVRVAREADAAVLVLGLSPRLEGEEMRVEIDGFRGGDRTRIDLPDAQKRLLEAVVATGTPTVLVLLNGSALAVTWADENVPAILEAWYGGQAAGTAIADVLFGAYNPAGRLPVTFYRSVDDLPPFESYDMAGRSYRYFEGDPLYAFGHGLSYTTFDYADLRTDADAVAPGGTVAVSVDVTNTGDRDGDEVVQLYVAYPASAVSRPLQDLRGFRRVHVPAGATRMVTFTLDADSLRYWDPDADRWTLEAAPVELRVGAASSDIRQTRRLDVRP